MGTHWVCKNCGIQYAASEAPPPRCFVCEDERQYVGPDGQQWTTLEELRVGRRNVIRAEEPGVWSIAPEPQFAIGQRAYLIRTAEGNVLWDCVAPLDQETVRTLRGLGGISRIAVSHPHFYTTMVEWAHEFGAPILLHEAERRWTARPDLSINFWDGETRRIDSGMTLIRGGGHFEGYQTLHWPAGARGRGVLFAGDQPQVCQDRRWVTFLYSYPNMIPLGSTEVHRILASLEPFEFDRIYGAFGRNIPEGAKQAVLRSAARYLRFIAQ